MKVRIKRRFRDKDTLQIMKAGEHVDYKPERAIELAGWGFVELLEAVEEKEDVPPAEEVVDNTEEQEVEKEEIPEVVPEKQKLNPFPEKSEQTGPKKRGRKPSK